MKTFGLIGKNISYSFSRNYFSEKFQAENIPAMYVNFDLKQIDEFEKIKITKTLCGLNVTIPYKQQIIPFLDHLDPVAQEIGAVNTVKFHRNGELTGYNTDYYGFMESLLPHLKPQHTRALILGTGGASKAVAYALKQLSIPHHYVSRSAGSETWTYPELSREIIQEHMLIINCTPLGTHPDISASPSLPIEYITPEHLIFDLIYNPPVTRLMQLAKEKGAQAVNGQRMLELQAEKAWSIWNNTPS